MEVKQGDRVKLDRDYQVTISNVEVKKGQIGTVRAFITSEEIALIQYGYNEVADQPLMVGLPVSLFSRPTETELASLPYKNIVAKRWHLGSLVMINDTNKIYLLAGIKVALNELDDCYELTDETGKDKINMYRYDLESKTTPVESSIIAALAAPENKDYENFYMNQEDTNKEDIDKKDTEPALAEEFNQVQPDSGMIELIINGFNFIVDTSNEDNRIITSVELTESNLNSYYDALIKINKIIKWR